MAQQPVVNLDQKKGRGRPPGSRARPPGQSRTEPWDYTLFRRSITRPDDFMDYMRGYPGPEGVTLFLYRVLPKIDLSLIGLRESNIQKGGYSDLSLFSFEAVSEKWGNGTYNIRVADGNRPEGQKEVVKSCPYKISDAGAPVYDIRTLVLGNQENIDEVNRQIAAGVLIRAADGFPRLRTEVDNVASGGPAPAGGGGVPLNDLVTKVMAGVIEKATTSPKDQLAQSIELARMLTPPVVDIEAAIDRSLSRLGIKGGNTLESEIDTYDRVARLLKRLTPGGGDSPTVVNGVVEESWAPHLTGIISEVRAFLPELISAWGQLTGGRNNPVMAQQAPPQTPPPTSGVQTPPAPGTQAGAQPMTLEQKIEEVFTLGLHQLQQGGAGFDFATWVCSFYPGGLEVYKYLDPHGTAGVMALLSMHPRGRAIANDAELRPKLEKFLDDFFEFDPEGGAQGGEAMAAAG